MKRLLLATVFFLSAPALAQDKQVEPIDDLQWLFIEDTVALIAPPNAATGEKASALMASAEVARAKGDNSTMRRDLAQARVLLAGGRWTAEAAYIASLAIRPQHSAIDPARPLTVEIGQRFDAELPLDRAVTIELGIRKWGGRRGAPGAPIWQAKAQPLGIDLGDTPLRLTLDPMGLADGTYELVVRARHGDETLGITTRRVFLAANLDHDLAEIQRRAAALKLSETVKASLAYPADLARTLDDGTRQVRDVAFRPLLDRTLALLAAAERGEDPLSRAIGDQERHYWLKPAARVEPYRLYIPKNWDGKRALPLVVMLHGSAGDHNSMLESGKAIAIAEQRGWALLSPMGYAPNGGWGNHLRVVLANGSMPAPRPSTIDAVVLSKDGVTPEPAEIDVLETVAKVRAEYPIDGRRIYLMGNSMGGEGTWYLSQRHPQLWAAAAAGAGAIEPAVYPYKRLGKLPVLGVHGDGDAIISFAATRAMVEGVNNAGGSARLLAIPGGGHSAMSDVLPQIFDFFATQRRTRPGVAGPTE